MLTLISGGRVIDPATHTDAKLNILIKNGKVCMVTKETPTADKVIDATDMVVSPGFIDLHMHEDPVADGAIQPCIFNTMLHMGVTTAVGGNCGSDLYDPVEYLAMADSQGVPVNIALLAGHGTFRKKAGARDKYGKATDDQRNEMERLLRQALEAGCVGVSFGLRYYPGTDEDEFYRAVSCCAGTGKPITAHIRDDASHVFDAIRETADAGRKYGVPVQISHIGSMGGFGQMADVLRLTDEYRMNGLDILLDCYPYNAFSTSLGETTYDDGWLERYSCGYDVLEYCEGEWAGKRADAKSFARLRKEFPDCLTVCHVMRQEDIDLAYRHPSVLIASDGILSDGQGHPRAAGTFPRVFAQYVRTGKLSLYDAIAKMTTRPAERMHLTGKGTLQVGSDADITIFNPETIQDNATFAEPILPPDGIAYVLLGGKIAMEHGKEINTRLGRAVRVSNRTFGTFSEFHLP